MTGPVTHTRSLRIGWDGGTAVDWQAVCSCGWSGPVRLPSPDTHRDWREHLDDELTALEADVMYDREYELMREGER